MPIYPMATIFQHGNTLLVSSLSFAGGRWPNGWFRHLDLSASDDELAGAVTDALARSRVEELADLPRPSSKDNTLDGEELGFPSWRAKEAATTKTGIVLKDDEVFVSAWKTVAGQGYSKQGKLPPAVGTKEVAARVREGLAESARLSRAVVDHEKIAAQQSAGATISLGVSEDPRARSLVGEIPNLGRAVLTGFEGRWAVESVSASSSLSVEGVNGWVRVVDAGDDAVLAGAVVEALTRSGNGLESSLGSSASVVVEALGVSSARELTGPGCVRIGVEATTSIGEVALYPQQIGDEGWWETPAHPETRSVGLGDPLSLWGRTIALMAADVARDQSEQRGA